MCKSYVYHFNTVKEHCRTVLLASIIRKFTTAKKIKLLNLGGEEFMFEKLLKKEYKIEGVSYENTKKTYLASTEKAPKGVTVRYGDILNHVYNGEDVIWFDFTEILRDENLNSLLKWITNNPLKKDCIFSVTYSLRSRRANDGHIQIFGSNDEYEKYIIERINYIGFYLENEFVCVSPKVTYIKYKNTNKSADMCQFIFEVSKR
jgi:hypothetical protein